jgi:hypothetical protein
MTLKKANNWKFNDGRGERHTENNFLNKKYTCK